MSEQKRFEPAFTKLRELGDDSFVVRGSTIIAEILPEPEIKTASGLILTTPSDHVSRSLADNRLKVAKVLMTGPGYYDPDTKTIEPLDVKPGAVILVPQFTAQNISLWPGLNQSAVDKLILVKEDNILCYYPSEEAFNRATEVMNAN
jgi:co-chaperonin GroES (HSP10)